MEQQSPAGCVRGVDRDIAFGVEALREFGEGVLFPLRTIHPIAFPGEDRHGEVGLFEKFLLGVLLLEGGHADSIARELFDLGLVEAARSLVVPERAVGCGHVVDDVGKCDSKSTAFPRRVIVTS